MVAESAIDPLVRATAIELDVRCLLAAGDTAGAVSRAQSALQILDQFGLNGTRIYLLAQCDLVEAFALAGDMKRAREAWQKLSAVPAACVDVRDSICVARAGGLLSALSGDAKYGRLLSELSHERVHSKVTDLYGASIATALLEVSALSDESRQFEAKKAQTTRELVSIFGKDCPVVRRAANVHKKNG